MASEKQHWANIRNAAKSTGPKTESGKLQSRRNAMRHGLTARTVVTTIEDSQEFEQFAAAIGADYQPTSAIEHELVDRLTSLLWRLRRSTLIETNLFELQGQIAADQKNSECSGPTGAANPELETFYRMLRGPATLVPSQSGSNSSGLKKHDADALTSGEITERHPNPAVIFLRLCNLNSFPVERINRYETALWRQAVQTMFLLDRCKKRVHDSSPKLPRPESQFGFVSKIWW